MPKNLYFDYQKYLNNKITEYKSSFRESFFGADRTAQTEKHDLLKTVMSKFVNLQYIDDITFYKWSYTAIPHYLISNSASHYIFTSDLMHNKPSLHNCMRLKLNTEAQQQLQLRICTV